MTAEVRIFKPYHGLYDKRTLITLYWRLTEINIVLLHHQVIKSDFTVEFYVVDLVENKVWLVDLTS